ncbi:MAG: WD repeat-containing protein jip5 [Sclerophora amabilis]|nr:MAG: WD repeat-containing protein jip5 [Sclerophora amabilis]
MFDCICTLPLSSELFTQALHPSRPLLAVGLSQGHVQTFSLPPVAEDASAEHGFGKIDTVWRTRRHKGSCRCLAYSNDGEVLYSGGSDGIVKAASTSTGQVTSKKAVPVDPSSSSILPDSPTLLHALSPQTLLLATDSSALYLYDLRTSSISAKPQQTHHPHDDYISSLTPIPASAASTSGFSKQWVTTGGSTLAVTDLRRGVLARSEDQEEELLSSVFVDGGFPAKRGKSGQKVLVGGGSGVITLWEKGVWDDQDGRITVDSGGGAIGGSGGGGAAGESLDTLTVLPDGIGGGDAGKKCVGVGMGDGRIKLIRLGINKVVSELRHDEVEGVVGLGVDVGGRLISGGGEVVKVWRELLEEDADDASDSKRKRMKREVVLNGDNSADDNDDEEGHSEDESSEEEEVKETKPRKKRKKGRGKDRSGGKQVMGFKDLV